MNNFGGDWTEQKIQILEAYAQAFLTVFKDKPWAKLLYFDGFAGSGDITSRSGEKIEGAALRILNIDKPRKFNLYYFVEMNEIYKKSLEKAIEDRFPKNNNTYVVAGDCNQKLKDMVNKFLNTRKGKGYKVLAFIDPKGMQLNWESVKILKDQSIDLWILSPTGGANRLLKNDGNIRKAWLERLNKFLGMSPEEVKEYFYSESKQFSMWGDVEIIKEKDAINKLHQLYSDRLKTVFTFITEPFVLKNSSNSIMFHFFMATNNPIAKKIADSVIKPKYKL